MLYNNYLPPLARRSNVFDRTGVNHRNAPYHIITYIGWTVHALLELTYT